MAVPKGKRSHSLCRKRQLIVFYDQLDGNFKRRREWFYRRQRLEHITPKNHLQCTSRAISTNKQDPPLLRPFRFPGFWPGRYVVESNGHSYSCSWSVFAIHGNFTYLWCQRLFLYLWSGHGERVASCFDRQFTCRS